MLWNIMPINIKLSKALPEFKKSLKKHWIPCNCVACRFQYYSVCTNPSNCLVNSYIVIRVKRRFIIFTWIGLVNIL